MLMRTDSSWLFQVVLMASALPLISSQVQVSWVEIRSLFIMNATPAEVLGLFPICELYICSHFPKS